MQKVLVSACLLGKRVRYDGGALTASSSILARWSAQGRVVSVCLEVEGGMSIPRAPAEISIGDGEDVWAGVASVREESGADVTAYFKTGAHMALALCQQYGIGVAVLTENSPSCGSSAIYDGSFTNTKTDGAGVTAVLLRNHGIKVFSQYDIIQANLALQSQAATDE